MIYLLVGIPTCVVVAFLFFLLLKRMSKEDDMYDDILKRDMKL